MTFGTNDAHIPEKEMLAGRTRRSLPRSAIAHVTIAHCENENKFIFQILAKHHEQCMQLWVLDEIDRLVINLLAKF